MLPYIIISNKPEKYHAILAAIFPNYDHIFSMYVNSQLWYVIVHVYVSIVLLTVKQLLNGTF